MLVFTFLLFYHLRFGIDPVYQSWLFDTCSNYPQFTHAAIHPPWICIQLSDWLKCFGYKVKMSEWVLQQLPSRLNPMGTMGGERMSFTTLKTHSEEISEKTAVNTISFFFYQCCFFLFMIRYLMYFLREIIST